MEFTEKNDIAKSNYKGAKANVNKPQELPALSLQQLEVIDYMKDFGLEPVDSMDIACYLDITGIDKLSKATNIMKNLIDKGYIKRTSKGQKTGWVLNQNVFDID